jgi:serine/threonine-protein kinase
MLSQSRIGRYEVVSALGPGATGALYKAVDPLSGRTVAIKTIELERPGQERTEFETRFYREAESAARLRHANIAAIYDVGEDDDIAYIAMEYLEGESLREVLDAGVVLPIEVISSIASRVANALDYAHENHVVHLDIRPATLMITRNRAVKIMDFGVTWMLTGSHAQLATILGTPGSPRYMAPEQLAGGTPDGRTDIFALGVVLYEMLTGVLPFDGAELGTLIDRVLKEEPLPPSTLNARVPPVFDRIVSRALAKRPRDRYQTALAFARDLPGPDAASPQEAAGTRPAKAVQASKIEAPPSGPPREGGFALLSSANEEGAREETASFPGKAQVRKPLLLALPLLMIVAFVAAAMYSRDDQAPGDELAVSLVTPAFSTTRVASASPADSTSADSATPPADSTPADSAMPRAAAPPRPAKKGTESATARVSKKTVASAKPPLSAKPDAPESASVPASASMTQAKATVTFAISPWGEVYVDGNSVGVSPPLAALQLAPGKHEVEIRNQAFAPFRYAVNLEPGRSLKIRHKFR